MSGNPPILIQVGVIPEEILSDKSILPSAKLIIYFITNNLNIDENGWTKTNIKEISDGIGIGEEQVRKLIKDLKKRGILDSKRGRYPRYSIRHHSTGLKILKRYHSTGLNQSGENAPIISYDDRVKVAAPDFFEIKKQHENLEAAMALIPDKLKGKVARKAINWWLFENNQGLDYLKYLGRVSFESHVKNPLRYYMKGIWGYYSDYLVSIEYQTAEVRQAIAEAGFKMEVKI